MAITINSAGYFTEKLGVPSGYSPVGFYISAPLTNLKVQRVSSTASGGWKLYLCVSDTNPSLLEASDAAFVYPGRSGANDIELLTYWTPNGTIATVDFSQFTNNVRNKEVIFKHVFFYADDTAKKKFSFYTGSDRLRNQWVHAGDWASDAAVSYPAGCHRIITDTTLWKFIVEDWGDHTDSIGPYNDDTFLVIEGGFIPRPDITGTCAFLCIGGRQ